MRFHKYHALGNDYIVMDPADFPGWSVPTTEQIRVICHRNFGAGSDGILWGPLPSTRAPFSLRIFNPDGSEAENTDFAAFNANTHPIVKSSHLKGGVEPGKAAAYALPLDSATAVRTANALLSQGVATQVATSAVGVLKAGSLVYGADTATREALNTAGKNAGLTFQALPSAPAGLEPVERTPRIAVLVGAVDQQTWVLRELGFDANPVSVATINSAVP